MKRYDAQCYNWDNSTSEGAMVESADGDYILYEEAQAEIEHLECALEKNRTYWKKEVDKQQAEIDECRKMLKEWLDNFAIADADMFARTEALLRRRTNE